MFFNTPTGRRFSKFRLDPGRRFFTSRLDPGNDAYRRFRISFGSWQAFIRVISHHNLTAAYSLLWVLLLFIICII